MKSNVFKRLTVLFLAAVISLLSLSSCSILSARLAAVKDSAESSFDVPENAVDYTLSVKSVGGMSFANVTVYIYDEDNREDLIWAGTTDDNGNMFFKADSAKNYIATVSGIPDGYKSESQYPVSQNTEIKLETVFLEPNYESDTYKLGDIVKDFSVTDVNGNVFKISELLKNKKAVILNFWFIGCDPCKMEFPYMQQAYDEYKDDIEILAINPYDGNNESVKEYSEQMKLSFPMFSCESEWANMFKISAFPTTIVIDKYGMVAFSHTGMITDKEVFNRIFTNFVSDGYTQKTYRNLSDIH